MFDLVQRGEEESAKKKKRRTEPSSWGPGKGSSQLRRKTKDKKGDKSRPEKGGYSVSPISNCSRKGGVRERGRVRVALLQERRKKGSLNSRKEKKKKRK